MSTPKTKNFFIGFLLVTTIFGAALAWHQYKELIQLRGSALTADDRADLQKKIWALQRENRELQDKLAAAEARPADPVGDAAIADINRDGPPRGDGPRGRGGRGGAFGALQQIVNTPEGQALMNSVGKSQMDLRYAALFKNLNLSSDQADKLSALLLERQNASRDVFMAAREQGINPRTDPDAFNKLVADAQGPVNDSIKALIGDAGVSQLNNYEQTMPQRNVVNLLQQRLSYSDTPLSTSQADQLVQILASTSPQHTNASNGRAATGGMFMGGMADGMALAGPGSPKISSDAVAQAGTVLNSQQLAALQQLQQQQTDAQKLRDMMRNANRGGAPTPAPAPKGGG